jgi:predicted transposase/invertase (TIGR01784 family)
MKARYINPFTDFGFKKLFGEEAHKELLIDFLNALLPAHHHIRDLEYTKNESAGETALDRKAVFDIACTGSNGERFLVELQKAKQPKCFLRHLSDTRTGRARRQMELRACGGLLHRHFRFCI